MLQFMLMIFINTVASYSAASGVKGLAIAMLNRTIMSS